MRGDRTLRFRADIDVRPRIRGDLAVNGQRTRHMIDADGARLSVAFDPHAWIDRLDVDALFAEDTDGDGAVLLDPSSANYESIVQGMLSRAPARFVWSGP